jgi:MFS family permease
MVLGLEALPILLAGPVGGLLVDRVILLGMSWVITDPARMSLIANIIPRANLLNAFSLNAMAFSVTRLTIPALGGVLLALVGAGPSILFMVGLQVAAFTMVLGLRLEHSVRPKLRLTAAFSELLEGARYVKNNRTLLGLFLLGFIPSVLVTPFVHGLMPVFAAEVFDVGPKGLGLLLSAIGAGATIGTVVLASLGEVKRKGRTIITAVAVMGLAMAVFTQLPTYWVALLALLVLSAGMSVFFATTSASVQGILTDDLRGRVSGLFMVTWGVLPAGSMLAGVLADSLGAPSAALIAAGITGVVLTALVLRFRPLWSFE